MKHYSLDPRDTKRVGFPWRDRSKAPQLGWQHPVLEPCEVPACHPGSLVVYFLAFLTLWISAVL